MCLCLPLLADKSDTYENHSTCTKSEVVPRFVSLVASKIKDPVISMEVIVKSEIMLFISGDWLLSRRVGILYESRPTKKHVVAHNIEGPKIGRDFRFLRAVYVRPTSGPHIGSPTCH